jgi:hypothetical protein
VLLVCVSLLLKDLSRSLSNSPTRMVVEEKKIQKQRKVGTHHIPLQKIT